MAKIKFAVLIAIFLLLSGCGGVQDGIPATSTREPDGPPNTSVADTTTRENTVTSNDTVSVKGGERSVDADAIFSNVLELTGADGYQPVVVVKNRTRNETSPVLVDDFGAALGLTPPDSISTADQPGGSTIKNTVYLFPNNGTEPELERVLAHEFVHVIQYQNGWKSRPHESNADVDANGRLLTSCLVEGSATYLTDEYVRRYSVDIEPETAFVRKEYLEANGTRKYFVAPYYFCSRYFHSRLDSPANVTDVFRDPPVTTEQVIHNYTPGEELPKALNVTVNETDTSWEFRTDSTKGELFTRVVLADAIPEENASRAAAGWGNDRLLEFQNEGQKGYVWILRWDSAEDADQFGRSFERYLEARGVGTDDCSSATCFDHRRLDSRTTAVVVGRSSFLSNVSTEREDSGVRVSTA